MLASSPRCWIPITTNAAGGIIAGQVIKYVGGVRRTFAVIAGIMLTGVAEWLAFGATLSPRIWACLPVMLLSMYMYSTPSTELSELSKPKKTQ